MTQSERFWQLRVWAEDVGACPMCATSIAEVQSQKEAGNTPPKPNDKGCSMNGTCFEMVRKRWGEMPARMEAGT